jgi:hypothetical protein
MSLKYITVLIIILFSTQVYSQQKYSIDTKEGQERKVYKEKRKDKPREIRYEDRVVRKANRKAERTKRRDNRLHKRAVKKHNRVINGGGKDLVTDKKVNKRMRKSRREAERINKGKNPVPLIKRMFK